MWRGSACSLVLFGLVLVITGLGEIGIFASVGADCEEDDGGDIDEDDINSDPSPLRTVHKSVSQWEKNGTGSPFCTVEMTRLTVWCVHTSV